MTVPPHRPPSRPAPRPGPLGPGAVAAAGVAVVALVLALLRPWGDTGVATDGALVSTRPAPVLAWTALAAVAALAAALLVPRRVGGRRWAAVGAGVVVAALGGGAVVEVASVLAAQVFPRDGGWWALVCAAAATLGGLGVAADALVRPRGRRGALAATAVAVAVPAALVVTAGLVAPGWSGHLVGGSHPAGFSESPGPLTVSRVGWRRDFGPGSVAAVLGGRVVVASDAATGGGCRLQVLALDAGSGAQVWSSARPLRCDGPRLAALDGDNATVRVTLRGSGGDRSGAAVRLYLGTEDGRDRPGSDGLDAVTWWTEGFGLVPDGDGVRGVDSVTGATRWSRPAPRCPEGGPAAVHVPDPPPPGTLASRTPYDPLGGVPGAVPATGTGNDVVLGVSCGGGAPAAWLVDVTAGATGDRVVPLAGGPAAAPTTFLTWLGTLVAVVPAAAADGALHSASLVGVDVASGAVIWRQDPLELTAVDLSPLDGAVHASVVAPDGGSPATVVLDVRSGAPRDRRAAAAPVLASVSLTQARIGDTGAAGVTVVDDRTGHPTTVPVADCPLDPTGTVAALLPGPGGVALRCATAPGAGATVVGLAP